MTDIKPLTIEIKNQIPIDLFDLNDTLLAFGRLYKRYLDEDMESSHANYRLCVREVRKGSQIFDLIPYSDFVPLLPEIARHAENVLHFATKVKNIIEFFKGTSKKMSDGGISIQDASDVGKIVSVTAKDNASVTNIFIEGSLIASVDSLEANAVQNRVKNYIESQKLPAHGVHPGVLMYWKVAENDDGSSPKDRAVIEALSDKPVKVIFASEDVKSSMVAEAFFKKAYIVDVDVQTINGVPKLYKILRVVDTVDRED